MLILLVVAFVAGIHAFVALLDPYGIYGRMANNLFQPVWMWGNNLLASIAERADSYAFYETDVWLKSLPTFYYCCRYFGCACCSGRTQRTNLL